MRYTLLLAEIRRLLGWLERIIGASAFGPQALRHEIDRVKAEMLEAGNVSGGPLEVEPD